MIHQLRLRYIMRRLQLNQPIFDLIQLSLQGMLTVVHEGKQRIFRLLPIAHQRLRFFIDPDFFIHGLLHFRFLLGHLLIDHLLQLTRRVVSHTRFAESCLQKASYLRLIFRQTRLQGSH